MSFEELVKKIAPTLRRITYKLNGHFAFFNEDDLYQEALIHLWQDLEAGKLSDKTESYILQGCYFHLKNYIRKTADKARLISIDALRNDEDNDLEETLSLGEPAQRFEHLDSEILAQRIQSFPLTQREKDVLSLCMEGLTVREIGKRLGVSHVRVVKLKNKIQHKCEKFKEEIKESYQK